MEELGIAIGTSYTSIFKAGNGIVLHEPTVIAYHGDPEYGKVRAIGRDAMAMLGKTPDGTVIVSPVKDGFIADPISMCKLLHEFLKKVLPKRLFLPKVRSVVGIPTGLTTEERRIYEDVFTRAGAGDVVMVENIMLSAVGMNLPVRDHKGSFVVNIGGGITDIAAISLGGILAGCSVNVGGGMMDRALIDYLLGKYNIKFGLNTIRRLKKEVGSLYSNDTSSMTLTGTEVSSRFPSTIKVKATDIKEAIEPYYMRISEAIESIINVLPPEVLADISAGGINITGGASKIPGLDKMLADKLRLRVNIASNAEYSAVLGAGLLLGDDNFLKEIIRIAG